VPLGWGEAYHPRWKGCTEICWTRYNRPYAVTGSRPDAPPRSYVNATTPGAITAVYAPAFIGRKPVQSHRVAVPGDALATAPVLTEPIIRPDIRQGAGVKSVQSMPMPKVNTYTQTPPRVHAQPQSTPQSVTQAPVRMPAPLQTSPQPPKTQPVNIAPVGSTGQAASARPSAATLPQREQRAVTTLPAVRSVAPTPVPHAAPVAVPVGTPAGQHNAPPKADKPAAPPLRAPGDVPAK
jgi:hypothetical protein